MPGVEKEDEVSKHDWTGQDMSKFYERMSAKFYERMSAKVAAMDDRLQRIVLHEMTEADEDVARWKLLVESVRWCTLVLGLPRALGVVGSARYITATRSRSCQVLRDDDGHEYDRRLAYVALSLYAQVLPPLWLFAVIEDTAGPTGGKAPWTQREIVPVSRVVRMRKP